MHGRQPPNASRQRIFNRSRQTLVFFVLSRESDECPMYGRERKCNNCWFTFVNQIMNFKFGARPKDSGVNEVCLTSGKLTREMLIKKLFPQLTITPGTRSK